MPAQRLLQAGTGRQDPSFDVFGSPVDAQRLRTHISVGISRFPGDGQNVEQLLEQADNAMYQAKRLGGGTCRFSLLNRPAD
ncbi:diguanylate cyclase domain-containing protein [Pseudomonas grimontii]|uniref:diguanylate cyclase domain-containing protein n=1 Tax=Pseudomonas grimontii TaxID=129847 RepID=UPI00216A33FE|nr:diguanylate cyclase [Pseudomonas grimontii]